MAIDRADHRAKKRMQKPKIKWQQLGLLAPKKDSVSIEEVRRQVACVASRGLVTY